MEIDVKLLDKCPELTDYEKDLIRRIDINNESQSSVAQHYDKKPSTISIQHKKAVARFDDLVQNRQEQEEVTSKDYFDKQAFRMFRRGDLPDKVVEKLGNVERVLNLWDKYTQIREDDYCKVQSKLAEYGYEPSGDSCYLLSEQLARALEDLSEWIDMLNEEDDEVRAVLDEQGLIGGLVFGGYGSTADGARRLIRKLQHTLI